MTTTQIPTRIVLLGATGEVGRRALVAALESPSVSAVYSFGRSPPKVETGVSVEKLHHVAVNFDALLEEKGIGPETEKFKTAQGDSIVIALGTTKKNAGSAERWEKIDKEYVLAAAKAAKSESKVQRMVYVSSTGASSSSPFLYPRGKGQTEEGLASLGYSETFIFRPGYLAIPGGRNESRPLESAFGTVTNFFSSFTNTLQIPTPILGKALVNAATQPVDSVKVPAFGQASALTGHPVWAIGNAGALALGEGKSPKL
ncbi:hypothetical protein JCM11641_001868 [Rhodosporidiobolus odoratus]